MILKIRNSRKEEIRTPDPYVPNVVRYQLRYFPIVLQRYNFFLRSPYFSQIFVTFAKIIS